MKIDDLDAIPPRIPKIAAERRLKLQFVFFFYLFPDFFQLRFVANHDPEMPHVCALNLIHFENREELVLTQFEESVALAATHLFEIENILVKGHRLLNVVDLNGHMITTINLHTHIPAYPKKKWCARHFLVLDE